MLAFLVTSSVRRRLLELLWSHDATGSASDLAARAKVSFASAYRELKRMVSFGLVETRIADGRELYGAAREHPEAELLRRLVQARPSSAPPRDRDADTTRRQACALGAPLAVEPAPVAAADREQVVVDTVLLARRDATLARVLPVMLWRQRDHLDRDRLAACAGAARTKHALGFFLDLTAKLSGDRTLATWARSLRDRRAVGTRVFFDVPRSFVARGHERNSTIARRWGFVMDLDLATFQAAFVKANAVAA